MILEINRMKKLAFDRKTEIKSPNYDTIEKTSAERKKIAFSKFAEDAVRKCGR